MTWVKIVTMQKGWQYFRIGVGHGDHWLILNCKTKVFAILIMLEHNKPSLIGHK